MKCVVVLSEDDELTLRRRSNSRKHRDFRTRAAGLPMLANKIGPAEIAEKLDVSG
ncbi:hypothetical protein LFL97_33115 [Burkholderia sp. JSH-S8]|nr:hypothetical protein LFL97_33115 [Burkholderia sp. JSH-S8]